MSFLRLVMLTMLLLLVCAAAAPYLLAQSSTSGDISGQVTDPAGAIVARAKLTVVNTQTGLTATATTNGKGFYRFALLPPGEYTITVKAATFQEATRKMELAVAASVTVDIQLTVQAASEVVEVTAASEAIQTDNANIATSITQNQIANLPNPGNDLTYFAQTAPGAVMSTGEGYGNFSTFGLPATSNLFTVNGMDDNDPFMNLNNSGATNLTLGANDISEATVINNGYLGEYGGLAASNVNYVTKSGTNRWHGNAQFFYNDDTLNANSWFNDYSSAPKTFSVAQQYAGSIGGPIKRDKAYIFFNAEGLYVTLPTSNTVLLPTPAFEKAVLGNLASANPSEVSFYKNTIFGLYNNAPVTGSLTPVANSCGDPTTGGLPSAVSATLAGVCAQQYTSTVGNHTHENMQMGRFDYNIGPNDRAYLHVRHDLGVQATYTDPISPVFNLVSNQPEWDAQFAETHTLGNSSVNQFTMSAMYYGAIFNVPNVSAALSAMPFTLSFAGNALYSLGYYNFFPNGRNVTQYQIVDDFSRTWRNHDMKFGVNFVRDDVSDWDIMEFAQTGGTLGYETLNDFYNGVASFYIQDFVSGNKMSVPIATYGLGMYAQDSWRARPNLTLSFALRAERNSNPVCQISCFDRFGTSFNEVNPNLADNQTILTNQSTALINFDALNLEPRFGFAYSPFGRKSNLVVRGGYGIFIDKFPALVADAELFNAPFNNQFVVGGVPLESAPAAAAATNASFVSSFNSGQLGLAAPGMTVPAGSLHSPKYEEWSLEVQKAFGKWDTVSVKYVGNRGYHEVYSAGSVNAYDAPGGFGGLPLSAPNPNFGAVNEIETNAVSNYNGLVASVAHHMHSLTVQFNYTWSHAIDEISNGGLLPYSSNFVDNPSPLDPVNPYNLRANYGNADYDIRHYASANWVWDTPQMKRNKVLNILTDWTVSGTLFGHTGTPYSVVDSAISGPLAGENYGTYVNNYVLANQTAGPVTCTGQAAITACPGMVNDFAAPLTTWGDEHRNQLRGPGYFDASATFMKNFKVPHWESAKVALGAQFFNIFNHPNFDNPVNDLNSPNYGTILHTVATPTSMYGSFLGADASPRQVQLRATLSF